MRLRPTILAVTLLAAMTTLAFPYPALTQSGSSPRTDGLSPYWDSNVSRWEHLVLPAAQERLVDPDLIAAVIWKESLGRAWERGPVGAVGLMGVMPFEWRPSEDELENPWVNVAWGTRALAHTIRDGKGDLFYALAAYNGGWEKIHLRGTRNYAADVLSHYVRAVAMRYELPIDGNWIAIFAVDGAPSPKTITVVGPQRPLARYTERPWVQADIPTVPADVPPHSTVITCVDEHGIEYQVNAWLVGADGSPLTPSSAQSSPSPPPIAVAGEQSPTPTLTPLPITSATPTPTPSPAPIGIPATSTSVPTATVLADGADLRPGASNWWNPLLTLPAGTIVELLGHDPYFPEWIYVRTLDSVSIGWAKTTDLDIDYGLRELPQVTPIPTLTPTPASVTITSTPPLSATVAPTQPVECAGGPLWLDAWDLEKTLSSDGGWTATIFLAGHGGNCVYTYTWESEIKGGPTADPITFEIHHSDRFGTVIGTASVTSAGETVEVGLFIRAP
jgi:hypothetical protein